MFILVWCGTRLVALFALEVRKCLNVKIAMPISTHKGYYLGLLLDPNYRSVIDNMADTIKSRKLFDLYYSEDLSSEDMATNDFLDELVRKGYSRRKVSRNPCFYFHLDCSFDEYFRKRHLRNRGRIYAGEKDVFLKVVK